MSCSLVVQDQCNTLANYVHAFRKILEIKSIQR